MTPYFADESVTLYLGDAAETLALLPAGSVDCCVTSPPYFGLRDYGVEGQLGLEASPGEYVAALVAVLGQVRRVLADDGTCWLNLGDKYGRSQTTNIKQTKHGQPSAMAYPETVAALGEPKNLMGMPWRVAFALQDAGWILRNAIVWAKPNAMPESVTDRLSTRYEQVFLLSRSARYWFDLDPIRTEYAPGTAERYAAGYKSKPATLAAQLGGGTSMQTMFNGDLFGENPGGKNPGDVWTIPTAPFAEAHFACMPVALAERCVQAGCKPGGTVLDPFSGSGTTGLAAARHGRRYVGIDLNAEYLDLSLRTRLRQPGFDFDAAPTRETEMRAQ